MVHTSLQQLLSNGARIIDVRSSEEFATGHHSASENIPLDVLSKHLDALRSIQGTIIIVCHSGARSSRAVQMLNEYGIIAINGGAWRSL